MYDLEKIIQNTSKIKVLYVEDNEQARVSTLAVLSEFFFNIIVAIDGEDGLEKFSKNKIDLIITDINMPNLDGLDMIEKIREKNKEIICSAFISI